MNAWLLNNPLAADQKNVNALSASLCPCVYVMASENLSWFKKFMYCHFSDAVSASLFLESCLPLLLSAPCIQQKTCGLSNEAITRRTMYSITSLRLLTLDSFIK